MKKALPFLLLIFILSDCKKYSLWVGNFETLSYHYSNTTSVGPGIEASPYDSTPYVSTQGASVANISATKVRITVKGVRVSNPRFNFRITEIQPQEYVDGKWADDKEASKDSSMIKTDIATVLVLDMSKSMVEKIPDLKQYAKNFMDSVTQSTPNSKVALVLFNERTNIISTPFQTKAGINFLKNIIDTFKTFINATALYAASEAGVQMLEKLQFNGSKSLVIFTDGKENASNNPDQTLSQIAGSNIYRVVIGLKSASFEKSSLSKLANPTYNYVVANAPDDLEGIFKDVARQVASVYTINYFRSNAMLDKTLDIRFRLRVEKIN